MTTTYGSLTAIYGFPEEVRLVRRGLSTPSESGFVTSRTLRQNVSRQTGQPQTRVWRVTFGPDGAASVLTPFDSARGAALPILWTPPPPDDGGGQIPVRFLSGTLRELRGPSPHVRRMTVELEEVA